MITFQTPPTSKVAPRTKRSRGGFTLIEMTVVVLIIGVLASVAIPNITDTLEETRVTTAAFRVAADLAMARSHAMSSSTAVTVDFDTMAESYSILQIADPDRPGQTYTVDLSLHPHNSVISSVSIGGDSAIQFDIYGQVGSGGIIMLQSGSHQQTVTINADSGKASVP